MIHSAKVQIISEKYMIPYSFFHHVGKYLYLCRREHNNKILYATESTTYLYWRNHRHEPQPANGGLGALRLRAPAE